MLSLFLVSLKVHLGDRSSVEELADFGFLLLLPELEPGLICFFTLMGLRMMHECSDHVDVVA